MTMVELIVTMALTSIFAGACVTLILPIERIYLHMTDLSRAQLLADTCVDSLRKECAKTYIDTTDDVQIYNYKEFDGTETSMHKGAETKSTQGDNNLDWNVLVMRKNVTYWESIASTPQYELKKSIYDAIKTSEGSEAQTGAVTSRAVYRMFTDPNDPSPDTKAGYVHFGYYEKTGMSDYEYYDFTNPFTSATYRDFQVNLFFDGLNKTSEDLPAYVNCTVTVTKNGVAVYKRTTILCFSSPVKH